MLKGQQPPLRTAEEVEAHRAGIENLGRTSAATTAGVLGDLEKLFVNMSAGRRGGSMNHEPVMMDTERAAQMTGADLNAPGGMLGQVASADPLGPISKGLKAGGAFMSHILPLFFAADRFDKIGDATKAMKLRQDAKEIESLVSKYGDDIPDTVMDDIHRDYGHHGLKIEGKNQLFYEVDDTGATIKDPNFIKNEAKLGDVYQNEELFKLVPELHNTTVLRDKTLKTGEVGYHDPFKEVIGFNENYPERFKEAIKHETEHGVQKYSGQPEGGGSSMFNAAPAEVHPAISEMISEPGGMINQVEDALTRGSNPHMLRKQIENNMAGLARDNPQFGQDAARVHYVLDQALHGVADGQVEADRAMEWVIDQISDPQRNYERMTGETTARIAGFKQPGEKMAPLHREALREGKVYKPEQLIPFRRNYGN